MVTPEAISRGLDRVLPFVQKPARYTGGEYNSVVKDWDAISYRLALVFPDIYDLGMSNLGLAILYDRVNSSPTCLPSASTSRGSTWKAAMRERASRSTAWNPPPPGRFRRARLQPALRAALHQRAEHARSGRHAAAGRRADESSR